MTVSVTGSVSLTGTSLPPPAAPLVGLSPVTLGGLGSVPAGVLRDMAGLASVEDATTVLAI
jgi:hypothetical protein